VNPVKSAQANANAVAGGTSGIGGGALVVWLLDLGGVAVSGYLGALIAGAVATAFLWLGKNGIRGLLRTIWRGSGT
jgi:hypothetical protein